MLKFAYGICAFSMLALAGNAYSQDLVYEPINPSFGGNSFNSAHLLAIANAQNDYERPQDEPTSQDDLDRFIRSLQSRLLSSLSTQVSNAIFGEDAQDEGTIIFGDQRIDFVRTLDGVQLTITEADGSTTVITIPTLITETDDEEDDGSGSTKPLPVLSYQSSLMPSDSLANRDDILAIGPGTSATSLSLQLNPNSQPIQ